MLELSRKFLYLRLGAMHYDLTYMLRFVYRWVVYLEDAEWCFTEEECRERYTAMEAVRVHVCFRVILPSSLLQLVGQLILVGNYMQSDILLSSCALTLAIDRRRHKAQALHGLKHAMIKAE